MVLFKARIDRLEKGPDDGDLEERALNRALAPLVADLVVGDDEREDGPRDGPRAHGLRDGVDEMADELRQLGQLRRQRLDDRVARGQHRLHGRAIDRHRVL